MQLAQHMTVFNLYCYRIYADIGNDQNFQGGIFEKLSARGGIFSKVSNFDRKSRFLALLSHYQAKLTLY